MRLPFTPTPPPHPLPPGRPQSKVSEVRSQDVYAVIVSPTRELATQISEVLDTFLLECPQFSRQLVIGGSGCTPAQDARRLAERGANIIVATPGRLHDLLQRKDTGQRLQAAVKALVRKRALRGGEGRVGCELVKGRGMGRVDR